jgi:hypothetical protein
VPPPTRPQVNLDPLAAVFDRVLSHPVAQIARELLPDTARAVDEARANLPALASGIEARAISGARQAAADLEGEIVGGLGDWIRDTIRAGRGEAPVRRLKARRKEEEAMSANLTNLRTAILSNTLTAGQQGALADALADIIPIFPSVDDRARAIPGGDESIAQTWLASLFAINAGAQEPVVTPVRVVTPSIETLLPVPFAPGVGGEVLLVADVTPTASGLFLVSVNIALVESAAGVPGLALFFVENLTAVTGGTAVAPALTAEPTSTTPAFGAGTPVYAVEQPSFNDGSNPNNGILTMASIPVQLTAGVRAGIIVVARDTGAQNWTAISAQFSAIEQPTG